MSSRIKASIFLFLSLAALLVVLAGGQAAAQVRLLESSPVDGASLETIEDMRFEFDGLLISDAAASVTVTRTNGQTLPVVDVSVEETVLRARVADTVRTGTYEIAYSVRSADGGINEGIVRVTVDEVAQSLSGGLIAVIGIFASLFGVMFLVFTTDKRRRPPRQHGGRPAAA